MKCEICGKPIEKKRRIFAGADADVCDDDLCFIEFLLKIARKSREALKKMV